MSLQIDGSFETFPSIRHPSAPLTLEIKASSGVVVHIVYLKHPSSCCRSVVKLNLCCAFRRSGEESSIDSETGWKGAKNAKGKCCTMSRELGLHKRSGKNQKRVVIKHNKEIIMHLNSGSDDGEGGRHSPRVLRFESFTFHLFIGFLTASLDGFLWLRRAAVLLSKLKRKATMFDEEKKKSIKLSVHSSLCRSMAGLGGQRRQRRLQAPDWLQEDAPTPQSAAGDWRMERGKSKLFGAGWASGEARAFCEAVVGVREIA